MKKNTKSILQKIIICILLIIFIFPNYSAAASGFGGRLIDPLNDLIVALEDGIVNILHTIIYGTDGVAITYRYEADGNWADQLAGGLVDIPVIGDLGMEIGSWFIGSETYEEIDNNNRWVATSEIKIGPGTIFSNQIELLDIDFFNPSSDSSTAGQLRNVIAKVYNSLRIISIVALLSVLVYIGIKILLGTVSNSDKAKYKEMLIDWIVAMCLLFVMHYIMAGAVTIVNKITDIFGISITSASGNDVIFNKIRDQVTYAEWFSGQSLRFGYILMYGAMIVLTIIFGAQYLKRVVYMAFLTMIAPLVALTYPIDKINDGKAQAFSMWFREYMFNLLIQPLHLILYYVLIVSAIELATNNMLYSLVAMFFMVPAEKLLRKFFGFGKAETPGGLIGGAVGLAAAKSLYDDYKRNRRAGGSEKHGNKDGDSRNDDKNIRYKDDLPEEEPMQTYENEDIRMQENNNAQESAQNQDNFDAEQYQRERFNSQEETEDDIDLYGDGDNDNDNNQVNTVESNETQKQEEQKRLNTQNDVNIPEKPIRMQNTNNDSLRKKINKFSDNNRLIRASRHYARGMVNKIPIKKPTVGSVARFMAKTTGATVGLVAGASVGLATGDASKMAHYTAAGVFGGSKVGGNVVNALSVEGTEKAYYGQEEYKQRQIRKNMKEAAKNRQIRQQLINHFGYEKAVEIQKEFAPECVKYGITDAKDIITVAEMTGQQVKFENESVKVDKLDAIRTVIQVNDVGKNTKKLGAKESKELDDTLLHRAKRNKRVQNDKQAELTAQRARKMMDHASGIKYKL